MCSPLSLLREVEHRLILRKPDVIHDSIDPAESGREERDDAAYYGEQYLYTAFGRIAVRILEHCYQHRLEDEKRRYGHADSDGKENAVEQRLFPRQRAYDLAGVTVYEDRMMFSLLIESDEPRRKHHVFHVSVDVDGRTAVDDPLV